MKSYRRIFVAITSASEGDALLQRAAEVATNQRAQMLVAYVLDTRSGFDPDGPAAILPEEAAARRAPEAKKRLDLLLARNNLGWAEARVVWGEKKTVLAELIRSWQPDLVIASASQLPYGILGDADFLAVARHGLFRRLAEMFNSSAPHHA